MNQRKKWTIKITALLMAAAVFTGGCGGPLKQNLQAFDRAVTAGNFPEAADIYREASVREGFDEAPFAKRLKDEAARIVASYKRGDMSFDQADLALGALTFSKDLNRVLREDFAKARASILPTENIAAAISQARLYAESGDYQGSLRLFAEILKKFPEHAEARGAEKTVLGEYAEHVVKESRQLETDGYPRTALRMVDRVLSYQKDNAGLAARKAELEEAIKKQTAKVRDYIPKYELTQLMDKGDLLGAQAYINRVKGLVKDVTPLQVMLNERVKRYIDMLISSAADLVDKDLSGRWTTNPYARAIAKLDEGLSMFPESSALLEAKSIYEGKAPVNAANQLKNVTGSVTVGATGQDANGFTYAAGAFNTAVLVKPDASFSYAGGNHAKTRIVIAPRTADPSVYKNMTITIEINGEKVYSDKPFAEHYPTLDLSYDLSADSEVRITVRQSGFASFFEKIMGRNTVFFELWLTN